MRVEEQTCLLLGLISALMELYPDDTAARGDEAFFAVLTQTQRVAQELEQSVLVSNTETRIPLSAIG